MTYPTYQAAKIANPECEIVRWNKSDEYKAVSKSELSGYLTTWCHCNPADYCMTYNQCEEFKAGMIVMDFSGVGGLNSDAAKFLNNLRKSRESVSGWDKCYILRAAALEETKTYRYEKVTDSIFDLKEEFERGELFSFDGDEHYVQIETEGDFSYAHVHENLYLRIEVTERELFLMELNKLHDEYSAMEHDEVKGSLYDYIADSGKFKLVNGKW